MPNKQNKKQVKELVEELKNSTGFILTDYRGLTVSEITELRKKLYRANSRYKIAKNTLLGIAFEKSKYPDFKEYLVGPTAIAFLDEKPVEAAKSLIDFAKEYGKLEVKSGYIDGQLVTKEQVKEISELPSREELMQKLLNSINYPIYGLVNVLSGPARGLATALSEIGRQKEARSEG